MSKKKTSQKGQGNAGGWSSTTGNPSGRKRSNNPTKKRSLQIIKK
tara:strand:- start:86202 stop:86336 length:135 start_codon:yes stop_codon:yes gene_type:complete